MRTCVRCGHQNPASASTCESCHGLMTLQLHSGAVSEAQMQPNAELEPAVGLIPRAKRRSVGGATIGYSNASIAPITSISLKTEEYTPEQLSFAESLSANDLFPEAAAAPSEIPVSALQLDPPLAQDALPQDALLQDALSQDAPVSADVGFSLAGASFHDSPPVDIMAQLHAHALRDPLLGQQVGQFRFVEKIGKGGFGAVYRAEHVSFGDPVAIKVLHLHQVDNPETVRRFQREARALAQLRHPSIVAMLDFGMLPHYGFYLVMELLSGDNVYSRLRARERFSLMRLKEIFRQLCDVLFFVHQKGIVHRDLKLSNIFLTQSDAHTEKLTLLDFGIAAIADDIDPITKTGAYIGTATYASPEQIQGIKELDGRSDLYSLGVLLFRLLTGKPPFDGRNAMDVTHRKLARAAPSLAEIAPERTWSPALEALIHSVLSREPSFRPDDARVFWEECGPAFDAQKALWGNQTQIDEAAVPFPQSQDDLAAISAQEASAPYPSPGYNPAAQESGGQERVIRVERQPEAMISLHSDRKAATLLNAHTLDLAEGEAVSEAEPPALAGSSTQEWAGHTIPHDAFVQEEHHSASPRSVDANEPPPELFIGDLPVGFGDTVDEAFALDEADSFATIRQAGLASTIQMTLEAKGESEGESKGESKGESGEAVGVDGGVAGGRTMEMPFSGLEAALPLQERGAVEEQDSTQEDENLDDAVLRASRDTLANPPDLEEFPEVAQAIKEQAALLTALREAEQQETHLVVEPKRAAPAEQLREPTEQLSDPDIAVLSVVPDDGHLLGGRTRKNTELRQAEAASSRQNRLWALWVLGGALVVALGWVMWRLW